MVIATPNTGSLARRRFGPQWVAWDPPRHLMLFSPENLQAIAERAGLGIESVRTSARGAWWAWAMSHLIRKNGRVPGARVSYQPWLLLRALAFHHREHCECTMSHSGEEVILIATKSN